MIRIDVLESRDLKIKADIPLKTEFSSISCNILQNSMEMISETFISSTYNHYLHNVRQHCAQHSPYIIHFIGNGHMIFD